MKYTIEKKENSTAIVKITVDEKEFDNGMNLAYKKLKNRISIPGFRRGKATRATIEKIYGPQMFFEEAINHCIPEAYEKFLDEDKELEIVSRPKYELKEDAEVTKKGFTFEATIAVKPPITLGEYKNLTVAVKKVEVTDEEVQKEIDSQIEKNARIVPLYEDEEAKKGDTCVIDYEGFVDDVAFDGGKGESHPLELGSNSFIPGFEDQLVGVKIGEDRDINVTFPADYHAKELAGKQAIFKCHVSEIKRKELPTFDDELVQEFSEFETVDEYRADVRRKLEERNENNFKREKEDLVVAKAAENATVDIPELMIETQTDNMLDQHFQSISKYGIDPKQYMQMTGMSMDQMRTMMKEEAEKRCRVSLVLEAITKAEGYTATEEEVENRLKEMAEQYKMELDKLKEMMTEDTTETLKKEIAITNAVKLITDSATVVEPNEEKTEE